MHSLEFVHERDGEIFAAVPASAAVFLLRGPDPSSEPYISKTANLRRRLQRLLSAPTEQSKRLNLRSQVRWIEYSATGSDFESSFLLYRLLRSAFPKTYSDRLRLRYAPLVKLHMDNPYPRASVTTRLGRLGGKSLYYGPFLSRVAAEQFCNDSLDFFKMRRCVDDLNPDPHFPGCIYSEMKMCLAPCFKGCTDEQYVNEVNRVQAYFDSGGDSLVREISAARDAASSGLNFENAAALHARVEKLNAVLSRVSEITRRIDRLGGVMVLPDVNPECVTFFRIDCGVVSGPIHFPIQAAEHTKSQSMEARVQLALAELQPVPPDSAIAVMEHLAMLKRWYFRGSRVGEIFLCDDKGNLPMRRMVRGISRVFRGEKPEVEPSGLPHRDPKASI
jgi:excinuclease ABC subunit C